MTLFYKRPVAFRSLGIFITVAYKYTEKSERKT